MSYNHLVYPMYDDIVFPEKQDTFLPSSLHKFLEMLVRSKNQIGQAIAYTTHPRLAIPAIPIGLGIEMDHMFWSKFLINKLSQLCLGISYDEVNRYKQSVIENNNVTDIQKELPDDTFAQYATDNVEHNICFLDGKRTFHGMGITSMATHKNNTSLILNRATKRLQSKNTRNFVKNKGSRNFWTFRTDI